MIKIVLFHPTGNANVREVAKGMQKKSVLVFFYTSIAVFPGSVLYKIGSISLLKELRRRLFDPILESNTKMLPRMELGRLLASKFGFKKLLKHETGILCIDAIYQNLDKKVASKLEYLQKKEAITAVYGYEDGALTTFSKAKELGLYCIYDLPIGYWKSARLLMKEEFDINADWSSTLTGFNDSISKLDRKDKELALADVIFVASSFTKKTLEEYSGKLPEIKVIPYGFPDVKFKKEYEPLEGRKLKILFIGGLSQRKGLSYLFEAVEELQDKIELTIVGHKAVADCIVLNIALERHKWIPSLPHDEVLSCMREHDVFVFPSLFEGFGLVITEAMSQGIPVITTERTAGPDIIDNDVDGWIVPAGSSKAIREVFTKILEEPQILEQFGCAAQNKAKTRPWSVYGQEMALALDTLNIL
jgi:glycosyltransferase involved in cell wall biosynthesis